MNQFYKMQLMIGEKSLRILQESTVCVVGIGGVGSFVVEALVRSGVGNLILVDNDNIDITNLNRQIQTNLFNVGERKVKEMKKRALEINSKIKIKIYNSFFDFETKDEILSNKIDFLVDAIDTITFKVLLIKEAYERGIPIISSMGMANKFDPTKIEIIDIYKTSYDPIAKILRKKLKELRIKKMPVVFSKEKPQKIYYNNDKINEKENREISMPLSSNILVPSVSGISCAYFIIKEIIKQNSVNI